MQAAVDIPMLQASDRGYVVIDDRKNRSMKTFIAKNNSARLYQLHVDKNDTFYHTGVSVGCLEELRQQLVFMDLFQVLQYADTSNVANLLATQTRRSDLFGPALQEVHKEVGRFLAERLLDEDFGQLVQPKPFSHVQGTTFDGIVTHDNMVIVPLMRGGEPMSRGVYEYFPCAQLIHYGNDDEKSHSLMRKALDVSHPHNKFFKTVVLVDSVVNEGNSIRLTIDHIQSLAQDEEQLRIVVLTAVMQKNASIRLPKEYPRVLFLALRISENKYAGKGGTDTGNRLFGTF
jgi:uracil phosphoribosyltransferase